MVHLIIMPELPEDSSGDFCFTNDPGALLGMRMLTQGVNCCDISEITVSAEYADTPWFKDIYGQIVTGHSGLESVPELTVL